MGALAAGTLPAPAASIDIAGLIDTYTAILILLALRSDAAVTATNLQLRFNGDTGSNYDTQSLHAEGTSVTGGETLGSSSIAAGGRLAGASAPANVFSAYEIWIPGYASTAFEKACIINETGKSAT